MENSQLLRMDNIGIVVESLDKAIEFFSAIGLTLEGRAIIEGQWAGRVTGLQDQVVEIAMMITPDGHSKIELSQFVKPIVASDHRSAPVNSLGYLRVMFNIKDIDQMVAKLTQLGARLEGEVVNYNQTYRLCYIRSPEGILVGLAESITKNNL